jgi:hypothetical protein
MPQVFHTAPHLFKGRWPQAGGVLKFHTLTLTPDLTLKSFFSFA